MAANPLDLFVGAFPEEYWAELRRLFGAYGRNALSPKAACRLLLAECRSKQTMYGLIITSMQEAPAKAIAAMESAMANPQARPQAGYATGGGQEPSPAQLAYLKRLGYEGVPKTKREASHVIDTLAPKKDSSKKGAERHSNGHQSRASTGDTTGQDPGHEDDGSPFVP